MTTQTRSHLSGIPRQRLHHYFAIDGGSGAHLLPSLAGQSPYLQSVVTPRHADILLIVTPVSQKLLPAIVEIAQAMPRPSRVLLVEHTPTTVEQFPALESANLADIFPGARRVAPSSAEDIVAAIMNAAPWPELRIQNVPEPREDTIQLPPKEEQEMATELAVLSLGPIQPFTAGPLRVLLVCDGEQVFSAQVESGYAHRGIAQAMTQVNWQPSLALARAFDPLAPIAGQLLYVNALEHLQHWQPSPSIAALRDAALALERAQNHLWWLVRFARLLDDARLTDRSYHVASAFGTAIEQVWGVSPATWILPQWQGKIGIDASVVARLEKLVGAIEALSLSIESNRGLLLRTRDIGVLNAAYLKEHDVSGPVLEGCEQGDGDVQSRLVARVRHAFLDIRYAINILSQEPSVSPHEANWTVPAGETHATIEGPRGQVSIHVSSDGGEQPARVEWQSSSAALLPLLPEILSNQILADAQIILASLDLAMAEVDG